MATATVKKVKLNVVPASKRAVPKYEIRISLSYGCGILGILYNGKIVFNTSLEVNESDISCGVNQLRDLPMNEDFRNIIRAIPDEGERNAILKEGFQKLIDEIKENEDDEIENSVNKSAFLLMSNNTLASSSRINALLDSLFTSTETRKNPNSSNNIKIWIA